MPKKQKKNNLQSQFEQYSNELEINICQNANLNTNKYKEIIEGIQKKSDEITNLNLIIRRNGINQSNYQYLGNMIIECKNLKKLDINLSQNDSKSQIIQQISSSFSKCQQLEELSLTFDKQLKLGSNGGMYIGEGIQKLQQQLKHLYIQIGVQNNLQTEGFISIANGISQCLNICKLELRIFQENNIQSIGFKNISTILQRLNNLLDFKFMWFGEGLDDKGVEYFGSGFNKNNSIQNLSITIFNPSFTEQGWKILLSCISNCSSLVEFQLNSTNSIREKSNFGEKAYQGLSQILTKCQNLQKFKFFVVTQLIDIQSSKDLQNGLIRAQGLRYVEIQFDAQELDSYLHENISSALSTLKYLNHFRYCIALPEGKNAYITPQFFNNLTKIDNLKVLNLDQFCNEFYKQNERLNSLKLPFSKSL